MSKKVTITVTINEETLARINALRMYYPHKAPTAGAAIDRAMNFALEKIGLEAFVSHEQQQQAEPEPEDEPIVRKGAKYIIHRRLGVDPPTITNPTPFEEELLLSLAEKLQPAIEAPADEPSAPGEYKLGRTNPLFIDFMKDDL